MSQVKTYNQKHKSKTFSKNILILLSTKNLKQKCSSKKLSHKFADSFCIADIIKKQVYYLYLFIIYQIHNVFYVFYLELYNQQNNNSITSILSSLKLIDNNEKYEIKKIIKKQWHKNDLWYKIKWKSYFSEYDQWISKHNMSEMQDLQKQYNEWVKRKNRKWFKINSENSHNTNYYYKRHLQHTERVNSLYLKRSNQLKNYIREKKSAKCH